MSARLWPCRLPALCLALGISQYAAAEPTPIPFTVEGARSSALMAGPADPRALVVIGHGAGLDMRSPLLASVSAELEKRKVATLRFNFPFAEKGRAKPDPMPIMTGTVRTAVRLGAERSGRVPLVLAGQSLAGLVIARAFEDEPPAVSGVVMIGYPLHQAGQPSGRNAKGLSDIPGPLLFVQGTHDPLADVRLMRGLADQLGARATLRVIRGANHRFEPAPGREEDAQRLIEQVAGAIAAFATALPANPGG